jgi:hypothetical protein
LLNVPGDESAIDRRGPVFLMWVAEPMNALETGVL